MVRSAFVALVGCLLLVGRGARAQGYSVVGPGGPSASSAPGPVGALPSPNAHVSHTALVSLGGVIAAHRPWEYGGVVPGNGVVPPGLSRRSEHRAHGRPIVAWPGFQLTQQGSRIFLAVTSPVQLVAQSTRVAGRLVWRVRNASVPVRNNRRALETEAFDTPVTRVRVEQVGRDIELVVDLRAPATPVVTQQNNTEGLGFVYLDFPPYTAPSAPANTLGSLPSVPSTTGYVRPSAPVDDTERPPPVRQ